MNHLVELWSEVRRREADGRHDQGRRHEEDEEEVRGG